jgi:hypothetical protein
VQYCTSITVCTQRLVDAVYLNAYLLCCCAAHCRIALESKGLRAGLSPIRSGGTSDMRDLKGASAASKVHLNKLS